MNETTSKTKHLQYVDIARGIAMICIRTLRKSFHQSRGIYFPRADFLLYYRLFYQQQTPSS